jgi:hypothetical protein
MKIAFQLEVTKHKTSTSLRERMDDADVQFDFLVFKTTTNIPIDEGVHRQAILGMGYYLSAYLENWDYGQKGEYLPKEYNPQGVRDWDVERALATPLTIDQVENLVMTEENKYGRLNLYGAFCNPPYGTNFKGGNSEAQGLFSEWLEVLGLEPQDDVIVINWVDGYELQWFSNQDATPGWQPWSDFFDNGLEWWGIWCLSIWNPRKQTLSVLVASTTD